VKESISVCPYIRAQGSGLRGLGVELVVIYDGIPSIYDGILASKRTNKRTSAYGQIKGQVYGAYLGSLASKTLNPKP
jgi:hypothetical protein